MLAKLEMLLKTSDLTGIIKVFRTNMIIIIIIVIMIMIMIMMMMLKITINNNISSNNILITTLMLKIGILMVVSNSILNIISIGDLKKAAGAASTSTQ